MLRIDQSAVAIMVEILLDARRQGATVYTMGNGG